MTPMIGVMEKVLHNMDVAPPAKHCGANYPEFPGWHPVRIPRAEIKQVVGRVAAGKTERLTQIITGVARSSTRNSRN